VSLRLVFLGTPDFAVASLARIVDDGHDVAAVYSQPPRRAGRGMAMTPRPSPASRKSRPAVRTPASLKVPDEQAAFAASRPTPPSSWPTGSCCPPPSSRRRGSAATTSMPRCCRAGAGRRRSSAPSWLGDAVTGISIMRMTQGLDEGPVCLAEAMPIVPGTTAGELHDQLAALGAGLMSRALAEPGGGRARLHPSAGRGHHLCPQDRQGRNPHRFRAAPRPSSTTSTASRPIPAPGSRCRQAPRQGAEGGSAEGSGPPGPFSTMPSASPAAKGAVRLLVLQREGKSPAAAPDFLRGLAVPPGTRLA
jgi:methionyl-tRNA formyltransferase